MQINNVSLTQNFGRTVETAKERTTAQKEFLDTLSYVHGGIYDIDEWEPAVTDTYIKEKDDGNTEITVRFFNDKKEQVTQIKENFPVSKYNMNNLRCLYYEFSCNVMLLRNAVKDNDRVAIRELLRKFNPITVAIFKDATPEEKKKLQDTAMKKGENIEIYPKWFYSLF